MTAWFYCQAPLLEIVLQKVSNVLLNCSWRGSGGSVHPGGWRSTCWCDSELATAVEEDRAGWGGLDGRAWNLTWTTCIRCYPLLILPTYPLSLPGLAEELVQIWGNLLVNSRWIGKGKYLYLKYFPYFSQVSWSSHWSVPGWPTCML